MAYELYWISGSPYSWRAQLGFMVKGLDYESKLLQASEREHKATWFLDMNLRGKVPVLKDGDTSICETMSILAYLDRKHPEPPLFGRTAEQTARIWQVVSESISYLRPAMHALLSPIFSGQLEENIEEVKGGARQVHNEIEYLERALYKSHFVAGKEMSAADVNMFPEVRLILRANLNHESIMSDLGFFPFEKRYPNLSAWVKRIESLPGYDKTYPPHWR